MKILVLIFLVWASGPFFASIPLDFNWQVTNSILNWPYMSGHARLCLFCFCAGILENKAKWESPKAHMIGRGAGCQCVGWQCTYDFSFGSNYCFIILFYNWVETDPNNTKVIISTRAFYNLVKKKMFVLFCWNRGSWQSQKALMQ